MKRTVTLTTVVAAVAIMATNSYAVTNHRHQSPPKRFLAEALCVHSAYVYTYRWTKGAHLEYVLYGHRFWRTRTHVAGYGEGQWEATVGGLYGGGFSFMLGTWNRAANQSHGRVPRLASTSQIAAQPIRTQVYAAWLIYLQDGRSWREWPNTGRACNLR